MTGIYTGGIKPIEPGRGQKNSLEYSGPAIKRGFGGVVTFRCEAETVDFLCPSRRNKGLKPLAPHDPITADLGFQVK
jgi:hypothetical protein